MPTAQQITELLQLEPLAIEGGYFRETYRSALALPADVLPEEYGGERNASTAIYYLLTPDTFSAIHRVKSDEVFTFTPATRSKCCSFDPMAAAKSSSSATTSPPATCRR